jgi:magnesium-transporting ATPase (P-type)
MNSFRGKITVRSKVRLGKEEAETQDLKNINFIARGSTNMSLHKIYLIVIHTGKDTKITMNLGRSIRHFKRSTLESGINKVFAFNFFVIVIISGISSFFSKHFMTNREDYDDPESK